jgi:uncharacterized membrane protein YfcA
MNSLLANLPLAPGQLLFVWVGVAAAYIIFGVAGFGTALVAGPLLALYVPVPTIVPMLALLDFGASGTSMLRDRKAADLTEVKRLIPLMAAGSLVGACILLLGRPDLLQVALGVFAIAYAIYVFSGFKSDARFEPVAAVPFGLIGGVFSALFGSGGFVYSIYLAGRLESPASIRVTTSTLIGAATLFRAIIFAIAGVYANHSVLILALFLLPAMLIGTLVGRHITLKLSRPQFLRLVSAIVFCSGVVLVARWLRA